MGRAGEHCPLPRDCNRKQVSTRPLPFSGSGHFYAHKPHAEKREAFLRFGL